MSDHVIQQEIAAQGAEPFTGDAACFWSWLGRMIENVTSFDMKPCAILNMLSKNIKGTPHTLIIARYLATTGVIDTDTISSVWSELIRRYGSQQLAFNQQLAKLKAFPTVKAPGVAEQLYEFSDLCHVTSLIPLCPDLRVLDFAVSLTEFFSPQVTCIFTTQMGEGAVRIFINEWACSPSLHYFRSVFTRASSTGVLQM